jgi:hypothetical protein
VVKGLVLTGLRAQQVAAPTVRIMGHRGCILIEDSARILIEDSARILAALSPLLCCPENPSAATAAVAAGTAL